MPRNKYPEQTVEKILDAAAALFAEKGYQSTTLQDIIDATGLSKGAVYYHFRSKEEIARKVGDRMGDEMWEPLRRIREAAGLTGLQKLQAVFAMSFAGDRQQRMGRTLPHLTDDPYFLVLEWQSIEERLVPECIAPLVRQGVADGSIHTGDPDALAGALPYDSHAAASTQPGLSADDKGAGSGPAHGGTGPSAGRTVPGEITEKESAEKAPPFSDDFTDQRSVNGKERTIRWDHLYRWYWGRSFRCSAMRRCGSCCR